MLRGGRTWSLFVACLGVVLAFGSLASLNVALPDIGADTGAGQTALTWVLDAYTLVLACLLLPFGAVGDRYGRRAVLVAGALVFTAGSLVPLWSDTIGGIIAARALSGAGAAMLLPATLAIITASYEAGGRGRAVGVWAATAAVAGVSGVILGGLLLDNGSWRSVFVATAIATAAYALLGLTTSAPEVTDAPRVDLVGAGLSAAAVALIVAGIVQAPEHGWLSLPIAACWVGGILFGTAFCRHQLRATDPLLDVRLFRDRLVAAASLSLLVQFANGFGMLFFVLQFLQLVAGMGPVRAGFAVGPMGAMIIVVSLSAPVLVRRFGFRLVVGLGFASMGIGGLLWARLDTTAGYSATLPTLLLAGVGFGLTAGPSTVGIVDAIPAAKQGVASAINDTTREVGAAIGIALVGSLLAAGYREHVGAALSALPDRVADRVARSPATLPEVLREFPAARTIVPAVRDAYMHGQRAAALALALLVLAGAVLVPLLAPRHAMAERVRRLPSRPRPGPETRPGPGSPRGAGSRPGQRPRPRPAPHGRNDLCPTSSSANPSEPRSAPSSAPSRG